MRTFVVATALLAVAGTTFAQPTADPICGRWLTADKQGLVHVYLEADGRLAGRIVGGSGPQDKDDKNPDPALRGRPIVGMKLMQGFARDSREWKGGEIYDPDEGKTYKATARLSDKSADVLLLRGYVGMPLFGRTEEWTRAAPAGADACRETAQK